jgi:type I restriction enzyme M protein
MPNLSSLIKSIRDIMREDRGLSGDGHPIEQRAWMLLLKIMDDKDQEQETLHDDCVSHVPTEFRWRNWAASR